jgi:flagellar hook-basal body complex protein FliE
MEAQKIILEELGREFGGSAAAQANTFAGKIEILKNQFDDLKEGIGKVIVDALTPFIQKLAEALNAIPQQFQEARKSVSEFFSDTSTAGVWIRDVLLPVFQSLRDTAVNAWNDIVAAIQPIKPELDVLVKLFGAALLGAIVAVIIVVGKLLETIIKVAALIVTAFSQSIQIIRNLWEGFFALFKKQNDDAVASFKKAWEGVKGFFSGLFGGMKDILINAVKPAIDLINKVIAKYNDLPGTKNISEIRLGERALGGAVKANQAYIVGEHRPEVFVPSQSGSIRPNVGGGMGGDTIVNIYNPPSDLNVESVIQQVERAINRKQELTRMGAI